MDAAFGYWLAGFADGEGCFRVQVRGDGSVNCSFSIALRMDDLPILKEIHERVGYGRIYTGRQMGASKPQAAYRVHDQAGALELVEIFDRYPLRAKKRRDFIVWRHAVLAWSRRDFDVVRECAGALLDVRAFGLDTSPPAGVRSAAVKQS